jgi:hypothetical protein
MGHIRVSNPSILSFSLYIPSCFCFLFFLFFFDRNTQDTGCNLLVDYVGLLNGTCYNFHGTSVKIRYPYIFPFRKADCKGSSLGVKLPDYCYKDTPPAITDDAITRDRQYYTRVAVMTSTTEVEGKSFTRKCELNTHVFFW